MLSTKKRNLPSFIKNSDIYEDMNDDDLVDVPKKFMIKKYMYLYDDETQIDSLEEYIMLFEASRYFVIDPLPKKLRKFHKSHKDLVLSYLYPKFEDIYIKNLIEEINDYKYTIEIILNEDNLKEEYNGFNPVPSTIFINFSITLTIENENTYLSRNLLLEDNIDTLLSEIDLLDKKSIYINNSIYLEKFNKIEIKKNKIKISDLNNSVELKIINSLTLNLNKVMKKLIKAKKELVKIRDRLINREIIIFDYEYFSSSEGKIITFDENMKVSINKFTVNTREEILEIMKSYEEGMVFDILKSK